LKTYRRTDSASIERGSTGRRSGGTAAHCEGPGTSSSKRFEFLTQSMASDHFSKSAPSAHACGAPIASRISMPIHEHSAQGRTSGELPNPNRYNHGQGERVGPGLFIAMRAFSRKYVVVGFVQALVT
jgi:hypothetical protein